MRRSSLCRVPCHHIEVLWGRSIYNNHQVRRQRHQQRMCEGFQLQASSSNRWIVMTEIMAQKLASLTGSSVHQARTRISGKVYKTPVVTSPVLSRILQSALLKCHFGRQCHDVELFFKCENFQRGGSFKFRGAMHCLTRLSDADLSCGLVTYSTGELTLIVFQAHTSHLLLLINMKAIMRGH